jgi:GTP-binding protein
MKIQSANYVKSCMKLADCPLDRRPEIAFAGRSNVGKSSLLNALLHRKKLAQTSKTPGKTRALNFYDVNEKFYFVDLPGYGYANVPKELKATWGKAVTQYLQKRELLRLCIHLVDSRHKPTPLDHELLDMLDEAGVPTLVVATKVDKLKKSQLQKALATIRKELDLGDEAWVLPFSSVSGAGCHDLWDVIEEQL